MFAVLLTLQSINEFVNALKGCQGTYGLVQNSIVQQHRTETVIIILTQHVESNCAHTPSYT